MTASKSIPGPCYPNWPDMRGAFAVHRQSADGQTCRYCGGDWPAVTDANDADQSRSLRPE